MNNTSKIDARIEKFQPQHCHATLKIYDLVKRGGIIQEVTRHYVDVLRLNTVARVDRVGQIEWLAPV